MSDPDNLVILPYLIEARRRLLWYLFALISCFICLFPFASQIYHFLVLPVLSQLPTGHQMIATSLVAPVLVPIKLVALIAFFSTITVLLYHLWAFIVPALYPHEKQRLWWILMCSSSLFYLGMGFAIFGIMPWLIKFLLQMTPAGVQVMPEIGLYLDFVLQLGIAFGFAFQVPLVMCVLVMFNIVSYMRLTVLRPYFIVFAFIIGMLLTPPDIVSQISLAVPLWLLFEIGLLAIRWLRLCHKQ